MSGKVRKGPPPRHHPDALRGISPEWVQWCQRWQATSPLATRHGIYDELLLVGRWLAQTYPEITSPAQWTRDMATAYVAAVHRMVTGEWSLWPEIHQPGKPLSTGTKQAKLNQVRRFFLDCQEWEWIPRRFNPRRCLSFPPSAQMHDAPLPRVIDDAVWAKLIWAGLNLVPGDRERYGRPPASGFVYPFTLLRAAALTWLFGGLRNNEFRRLRVGCVRMEASEKGTVCWLDIPASKSRRQPARPVDNLVGEAITAWEAERPPTPPGLDTTTGEAVQFLFQYRDQHVGVHFLNKLIIPWLCAKAGIPQDDSKGPLTSHRARATIASQLANAPDPMPLLALQAWLGHSSPRATLHYVQASTATLTKAYTKADYLARNVRTIRVFIDQEALKNGDAAAGAVWKYYDLGHGYCTYDFFERCPHRMACARCSFYRPKPAARDQLLESQQRYVQMLADIPLTEDEQAVVEADLAAVTRLLEQLKEIPAPDGARPHSSFVPLDQVG